MRKAAGLRATVMLALFAGAIDQTAMAALLPAIVSEFAIPLDQLDSAAWTVTLYLGAYAAVLPVAGRAIDHGAANLTRVAAIALFGSGSAACALAGDIGALVAARAVQAVGAGVLVPLALADAASAPQPDRRLVRLGIVMAVAEAGAVLGPLYGATFLALADWRWAFWANVPIAFVLFVAWVRQIARAEVGRLRRAVSPSDAFVTLAVVAAIVGVSRESARLAVWLPWLSAAVAAGALVGAARAGTWSNAAAGPRSTAGLAAHLFLGIALVTPLVLVPVWANTLLARSPEAAALVLLRFTVAIPPLAFIGALVAPRLGRSAVAALGYAFAAIGLAMMSGWSAEVDESGMTPALLVAGGGFGLLLAPTTEALLDPRAPRDSAARLGWATATRVIGMAVGLAAMTIWGIDQLTERLRSLPLPLFVAGEDPASLAARVEAYRRAATDAGVEIFGTLFAAGAVAALLGAVASVVAIRSGPAGGRDLAG